MTTAVNATLAGSRPFFTLTPLGALVGNLGAGAKNLFSGFDPDAVITALFASGEQGVFFDPSDLSTMFQESTGITPVTADGQPVGLILDKSKGLVLGPELVTNGDFSNGSTGWTLGTGWTVSGGAAISAGGNQFQSVMQNIITVTGTIYKITLDVTYTSGSLLIRLGGGTNLAEIGSSGSKTYYLRAEGTGITFLCNATGYEFVGSIDNISVKELPGNHGVQSNAALKPALRYSPYRIDYDAVDDTIVSTFASSLGTNCTVCRAVAGVGANILTAQTIGTSYSDSTDHCGLIVIDRALTAGETSDVTAYLNAKAGV